VTVPPTRQDLGGDSGPVWSPDGRRLVFERDLPYWGDDRFRLNAVSSAGGIARPLTPGPFDVMPSVSPDGTRIAFTRLVASVVAPAISLFTVNARGQRPAQLLAGGFDVSPAWSPDGTAIAFSRLASETATIEEAELYLAAANGSNVSADRPGRERRFPVLVARRRPARVRLVRRSQRRQLSGLELLAQRGALRGER